MHQYYLYISYSLLCRVSLACNKETSDVENVLNDDDIFADTVDTQKEGVEQQRKGKYFKDLTYKGKLLSGKKSKET